MRRRARVGTSKDIDPALDSSNGMACDRTVEQLLGGVVQAVSEALHGDERKEHGLEIGLDPAPREHDRHEQREGEHDGGERHALDEAREPQQQRDGQRGTVGPHAEARHVGGELVAGRELVLGEHLHLKVDDDADDLADRAHDEDADQIPIAKDQLQASQRAGLRRLVVVAAAASLFARWLVFRGGVVVVASALVGVNEAARIDVRDADDAEQEQPAKGRERRDTKVLDAGGELRAADRSDLRRGRDQDVALLVAGLGAAHGQLHERPEHGGRDRGTTLDRKERHPSDRLENQCVEVGRRGGGRGGGARAGRDAVHHEPDEREDGAVDRAHDVEQSLASTPVDQLRVHHHDRYHDDEREHAGEWDVFEADRDVEDALLDRPQDPAAADDDEEHERKHLELPCASRRRRRRRSSSRCRARSGLGARHSREGSKGERERED